MKPRLPTRQGRPTRLNLGRLAAVRALIGVEDGDFAEDLLVDLAPTGEPDRGLAWHITLGVLRRRGALDAALSPFLRQEMDRLDPPVRAALRVGAFELLLSRTPIHAAVDQAVEACRHAGAPRASGLVNAVLRKVAKTSISDDPWLDLPPWLAQRWTEHGPWVERLAQPPGICGVWRDQPVPELPVRAAMAAGEALPGAFRLVEPQGRVTAMPGFRDGRWWVMDPAATKVADIAFQAAGGRSPRILDACAAPGGKSFRMAVRGARCVAVDIMPHRLERVEEGARRLGLEVPTVEHDWLGGPRPDLPQDFDAVLVDAPCSALGTVRRHPEIKWRRLASDPAAMALRQLPILRAASAHVKPDGALVYAVCSPEPEEGRGVVDKLDGWQVTDEWSSVPPQGDEDAFQAFVLRRRSASTVG